MKKKISFGACVNFMFALLLIPMIVISVSSYVIAGNIESAGKELYTNYGKTQGEVAMGFSSFQELKCDLRNSLYLYADNPEKQEQAFAKIIETQNTMDEYFDKAEKGIIDEEGLSMLQEAREQIALYVADLETCVAYAKEGKLSKAREHLNNNGVDSANAAAEHIRETLDKLDNMAGQRLDDVESEGNMGDIIIGVLFLVGLLSAVVAIQFMRKYVKKFVTKMAKASEVLAVGDVNVQIPEYSPIREMTELLEAFERMVVNQKKQAAALERIAQGDLTVEMQASSKADVVGNALVKLIHDDNSVFNSIRNATNQITVGSNQIAIASQTLAQGSTEQASAIQQISASITDIADKTKNNADQADEVNRIVLEAKEDVEAGNERMREMVAAMNEINDASENIQKIIKVIDDIAFNTNILALNATVEAARAGEQGKGFAVVAEEVRNLAGRSAEASSQTAEMIEDSIQKVKRGGDLAKKTAEALELVSDMIEKITGLSMEIAKSSNDQASATAQIDQALMQVSQVVQTNSATSEQCASASEELSGQARGLKQELAKFQLKDVIGNMPSQTLDYVEPNMLETTMKY